ncbi:MAG: cation-translocating P-type ATPase [Microbacteriaceae bacterium]|nr:MAG: cation-translocating P-type ATPase [Microbacteriaceae bacterium]
MTRIATAKEPEASLAGGYWAEELSDGGARFRAKIGGLHCSLCTGTIERALGRQDGVENVAVSLTHEQALVEYDPARVRPEALVAILKDIGYTIWDPRKIRPFEEEEAALVKEGRRLYGAIGASLAAIALIVNLANPVAYVIPVVVGAFLLAAAYLVLQGQGKGLALGGTVVVAAVGAGALALNAAGAATGAIPSVVGVLAVVVVFGLGGHVLSMAAQSLRRGILNQHVMLEAGAFAGLAGGVLGLVARYHGFPTAAFFAVAVLVVNYHIFSEWLSLLVKTRSSQAVKALMDLQPDTARVIRGRVESEVSLSEVVLGDRVRVRPGERVPIDGVVVDGRSALDQSLVTGESVRVTKVIGDAVIGGSINTTGTLVVEVSAVGDESFLAQVVRSVEDARALKPGILHLVDRILRVYTPVVLSISVLSLVGWLASSWAITGTPDVQRAVFAALSVLVMGYPCAVGIAAPLSIVRGAGEAADQGIIMRTGEAFQAFRRVGTIALDKTGTLTEGRPGLRGVLTAGRVGEDEVLTLAAAAEVSSEHPLARAIVDAALDRRLPVPAVDDFESVTGQGVTASIGDRRVVVGRPSLLEAHGMPAGALAETMKALENSGHTVVVVGAGGVLLGALALGDEIRSDAAETVAGMCRAGLVPVLVTGDDPRAAARVAARVGIQVVHAGVLPGAKADIIRDLQRHGSVAMVGDGINDAPALMQANVGVAMGGGTDIAMESADIIIMSNRLTSILAARDISAASYRKTRQNVALAFAFNGLGIPLAATGLLYPVWAMAAMAVSVTAIFANSLWRRPALLFDTVRSVGRHHNPESEEASGIEATT